MTGTRRAWEEIRAGWMFWALAIALGTATIVLPRAARLNRFESDGMLTTEAYAMVSGIMVAVLVMALRDPSYDRRWATVIALAPLVETTIRMVAQGPGNLWPIAIFLALVLGFAPAYIGLWLARSVRYLFRTHTRTSKQY